MTTLRDVQVALPASPAEAVAAFGDGSGVTVIAGGTIAVPELNAGRLRPARAILLGRAGMDGITRTAGVVRIGAACPLAVLEAGVPDPLAAAAREVGDQEIRGQGTLGGNLCAPPADDVQRGDLRAPLIALAAQIRSAGAGGERTGPVEDFLSSASSRTRLLLEVEFEEPRWAGYASLHRAHAHHYTVLAVSAAETSAGLRIAVTGAGGAGVRLRAAEASGDPDDAVGDVEFADDALASAWYRRRMLPVLVARALATRTRSS
ncbi:MAG TPA: FAD binding domain-containing protein [Actinomycetota bacterium]